MSISAAKTSYVCVLGVMAMTALPLFAQDRPPVAEYLFADAQAPGADSSGQGHAAVARGATVIAGPALRLDGQGGLEAPNVAALSAAAGFTLEFRVRFATVSENMNLFSKEGEYLLRTDPPGEGGNLSFFVDVAGSLEPRVRGPVPRAGVWHHVFATWDGLQAMLWVDGRSYASKRAGAMRPGGKPALIGLPSKFGPVGLKGDLAQVRLYDRALSAGEVLWRLWDLQDSGGGSREKRPRFEFAKGVEGWVSRNADAPRCQGGALRVKVGGGGSVLVRQGLAVPTAGHDVVSLRMSQTAGQNARLTALTAAGLRTVEFPVMADGQMHSYILDFGGFPEWHGEARTLALEPSDAPAEVALEFLRLGAAPDAPAELSVTELYTDAVIPRAGRPVRVTATIRNTGGPGKGLKARLVPPAGVVVTGPAERALPALAYGQETTLPWQAQAAKAASGDLKVAISGPGITAGSRVIPVTFTPAVAFRQADYVPPPQPPPSDYLVGAHYCPLWKQGSRATVWEPIVPFAERKPALGYYDEDDPEVTDWEIKWALDHGIQYFVYCWYRANQGQPVEQFLGHAIHDGLFKSRYGSRMKFTIMWENQSKGSSGVASEQDFLETLLPYWIETYFKRDNYLKVDNKPLLFIYRPEFLVDDLGSVEKVRQALDKAREVCKRAGFDGLTVLGEYRGTQPAPLQLMVDEGLDEAFQYCWPVASARPTPAAAVTAQEGYWESWLEQKIIPFLVTVSMGWDSTPWSHSYSIWRLPPKDFEALCRKARAFVDKLPAGSLGRKLVLLDNWNEFGEGHYIFPHRQYGFGYLDAVRRAFTSGAEPHTDYIPEDLGLGPYDKRWQKQQGILEACSRVVKAESGLEEDLLGWWNFEEDADAPVAFDVSGHGLGGIVDQAPRAPGKVGQALVCQGGSVSVPAHGSRFDLPALSVECWVKTEVADQTDKWFVNCVYGDGGGGFRLGLSGGKLAWAIPQTPWSHQLVAAAPLPLGRWVHVAATYDGREMRLYAEGRECGIMERIGKVQPITTHFCLGSYDPGHKAHFTGLLDEVRILSRALTGEEVEQRARR